MKPEIRPYQTENDFWRMREFLRRLQRMGALTAFVAGYSTGANALYRSVMGPDHEMYEVWIKEW